MSSKTSLSFGVENKPDIEQILGSSDLIPENELHVQRGTDYAKKLGAVDSEVSVALVARSDPRYGVPGYTVGFINVAKVVLNDVQARPLMINHGMVERERKEFRDNGAYPTYELEVISPPVKLFEFFRTRGTLAPYATPHRI